MPFFFERLAAWIRRSPPRGTPNRTTATRLIEQLTGGGLDHLDDRSLIELVDLLLAVEGLRIPLRGNVRFLQSVATQFHRKLLITTKQRQGIRNILERAYPHNLAAELRRL